MEVLKILKRLESDPEFKEWKQDNPDYYLAHIFFMVEPNKPFQFDIGFYHLEKNLMTTFLLSDSDIQIKPDQEIFKDPEHPIKELDPAQVKIEYDKAMKLSNQVQQEHYKADLPSKEIVILQNIPQGLVWNITFMTQTFKTLNIKIDAASGDIVGHKIHSLMDLSA